MLRVARNIESRISCVSGEIVPASCISRDIVPSCIPRDIVSASTSNRVVSIIMNVRIPATEHVTQDCAHSQSSQSGRDRVSGVVAVVTAMCLEVLVSRGAVTRRRRHSSGHWHRSRKALRRTPWVPALAAHHATTTDQEKHNKAEWRCRATDIMPVAIAVMLVAIIRVAMAMRALGWVVVIVARRVDVTCTSIVGYSAAALNGTAARPIRQLTLIEEGATELARLLFEGHLTPSSRGANFAARLGRCATHHVQEQECFLHANFHVRAGSQTQSPWRSKIPRDSNAGSRRALFRPPKARE